MSFIHSIRTSVPEFSYSQIEFYEKMSPLFDNRSLKLFQRILDGSQIRKRHFSTSLEEMIDMTLNKRVRDKFELWKLASTEHYVKLFSSILNKVDLKPDQIDGICLSTTSGFVMPNIDLYLVDKFNMKKDIMRMPFFSYGCSGGISAINRVNDYLNLYTDHCVLVCVGETLSTQLEAEGTPSNLVTNSLFGDGYSVLLMVGKNHPLANTAQIEIHETSSYIFQKSGYLASQWMTDIGINSYVDYKLPKLLKEFIHTPMDLLTEKLDYSIEETDYFICHAGGPKVIGAFAEAFDLNYDQIHTSLDTYRDFGNQSAVSVLSAMERTLVENELPGSGYLMALGPGITLEHAICSVNPTMKAADSFIYNSNEITKPPVLV